MNRQRALNILNLDADASFDEAKHAYRRLAKKYHPDVFKSGEGLEGDLRMKEINLAFLFLTPILKKQSKKRNQSPRPSDKRKRSASQTKAQEQTQSPENSSFFNNRFDFIRMFKKIFAPRPPGSGPGAKVKDAPVKAGAGQPVTNPVFKKNKSFAQVMNRVRGRAHAPGKSKPLRPGSSPWKKKVSPLKKQYQGYQSYMVLKKKMAAARKRSREPMGINRVEKIQPVQRVNPVQRD